MGRFTNKIALVAGGFGKLKRDKLKHGLSYFIAKRLVDEGAKVIIVDLNYSIAQQSAQDIGENIEAMECDLLKDRTYETEEYIDPRGRKKTAVKWIDNPALSLVESIVEKYGSIDILITNFDEIETGRAENITIEHFDKMRKINITPVFHLTAAVREQMSKQKKEKGYNSKVVFVTSNVGKAGMSIGSVYSAFKGSIVGFTKCMGKEFSRFANVNAVACGPFAERKMQGPKDRIVSMYFSTSTAIAKEPLKFEDVVPTISFLASGEADKIAGQIISVDGGMWLKLEQ